KENRSSVHVPVCRSGRCSGGETDDVGAMRDDALPCVHAADNADAGPRLWPDANRALLEGLALDLDVDDRPPIVIEYSTVRHHDALPRLTGGHRDPEHGSHAQALIRRA